MGSPLTFIILALPESLSAAGKKVTQQWAIGTRMFYTRSVGEEKLNDDHFFSAPSLTKRGISADGPQVTNAFCVLSEVLLLLPLGAASQSAVASSNTWGNLHNKDWVVDSIAYRRVYSGGTNYDGMTKKYDGEEEKLLLLRVRSGG